MTTTTVVSVGDEIRLGKHRLRVASEETLSVANVDENPEAQDQPARILTLQKNLSHRRRRSEWRPQMLSAMLEFEVKKEANNTHPETKRQRPGRVPEEIPMFTTCKDEGLLMRPQKMDHAKRLQWLPKGQIRSFTLDA